MIRITHTALIVVMFVTSLAIAARADMYKGYETPRYEVVDASGDFELRRTLPHLVAEVSVAGDREGAIGRGFWLLADYIFGGNATGEKIAITSPVTQLPAATGKDVWTVRFMMPESYDLDRLPAPKTEAVRFVETRPETHLVIRFSGRWQDGNLSGHEADLRAEAARRGLSITGGPIYHFYDGPFTLPWNRRNEIAVIVG